ncbi:MAG: exodeoxyribonuclease I [Candidatus Saccharibacteria bacterium]|nr:exodeoxyribonuclease I [Candidatus Saccharibacteria bacterium]
MDETKCFFFYDLETSGLNPREDRIMQFAGIRTDLDLNPVAEPVNILLKLPDDTLPSPGAIAVTKITPQMTQQDGLTEAEFCHYVTDEIFIPGTCALGFNSVRFDDEFMRHLFWRNFYDPYEWQWKDGRSRWDILDLVRLTRALRPEGINWPTQQKEIRGETVEVKTNRLELITKLNNIEHEHAHDALADVYATVAVAKLIKEKQPELFDFLFKMRNKRMVQKLVNLENPAPFVYTCGRYSGEYDKTTVAFPLAPSKNGNVLVYDLRQEPSDEISYPTIKELYYNRCPAVAPLGVLDKDSGWEKIGLDKEAIEKNLKELLKHPEIAEKAREENENRPEFPEAIDPESALYDGFLDDGDRSLCGLVRAADKNALTDLHPDFTDDRLEPLLLHYKAKNFPGTLSEDEQKKWEGYRLERLKRQAGPFEKQLEEISGKTDPFIVEELLLWYQSLAGTDY